MKRRITFASALAAVVLAVFPLESQAFFFGFSFGGGSWGHPYYSGWHSPYYHGYGYRHYLPVRHYALRANRLHRRYARLNRLRPFRHYAYDWDYVLTPTEIETPELIAAK